MHILLLMEINTHTAQNLAVTIKTRTHGMCEHMQEDIVMYQASSVRNVTKHLNGVRNANVTWTITVNR